VRNSSVCVPSYCAACQIFTQSREIIAAINVSIITAIFNLFWNASAMNEGG